LCCYNRIPKTGLFTKNRDLVLTVLEAGKSKVEGLASDKSLLMVEGRKASQCKKARRRQTYLYNKPSLLITNLFPQHSFLHEGFIL
jgi:hypothetical protein